MSWGSWGAATEWVAAYVRPARLLRRRRLRRVCGGIPGAECHLILRCPMAMRMAKCKAVGACEAAPRC
eukprot:1443865-Pyramimonas_sp.AAC.1